MSFTVERSAEKMPKATRNRKSLPDEVIAAINDLMDPKNEDVSTLNIPGDGKIGSKQRADSARANASKVTHYIRTHWDERVGEKGDEKVTTQYKADQGFVKVGCVPRSEEGSDEVADEATKGEGTDEGTSEEGTENSGTDADAETAAA